MSGWTGKHNSSEEIPFLLNATLAAMPAKSTELLILKESMLCL
jgi:hypothetical protein